MRAQQLLALVACEWIDSLLHAGQPEEEGATALRAVDLLWVFQERRDSQDPGGARTYAGPGADRGIFEEGLERGVRDAAHQIIIGHRHPLYVARQRQP